MWQVQRYSWKKEMVVSRSNQLHLPLTNAPINGQLEDSLFAFRPLTMKGFFVPNTTFFLYPRSPPPAVMTAARSNSTPQVGAYVYTLLQRTDNDDDG